MTDRDEALAHRILAALRQRPMSGADLSRTLGRRRQDVMHVCQALRLARRLQREGKAWALVPAARCEGTNTKGAQCSREAAAGSAFCTLHEPTPEPDAGPEPFVAGTMEENTAIARRIAFMGCAGVPDPRTSWTAWRVFLAATFGVAQDPTSRGVGAGFARTAAGRQYEDAERIKAIRWLFVHDEHFQRLLDAAPPVEPGRTFRETMAAAIAAEPPPPPPDLIGIGAVEFFDGLVPYFTRGDNEPRPRRRPPTPRPSADAVAPPADAASRSAAPTPVTPANDDRPEDPNDESETIV
jgi:hypothetical protein